MIYKLSDIAVFNAKSLKAKDNINKILYLDTSSIVDNEIIELQELNISVAPSRAQRRVKDNTIIISTVRPNMRHFGILKNPDDNLIVSTGFCTIDVKDDSIIDAPYLYYLLSQQSVVNYLQAIAQNAVSAYPSINPSDIMNLCFDFPKIEKQRDISSFLSNIDEKIKINKSINHNLEAMAKQLYDYWFVQFDFPDENGKPYKSSGGKMVWNEKLRREIPENWDVVDLQEIADIKNGATPSTKTSENYGGDIVWVTPKDLSEQKSKFVYQSERTITQVGYDSCSTNMLPIGSVLLSSRAPIGLLSIAKIELCTNQGFKNLVPKNGLDTYFLYYYIKDHISLIEQLGSGTTFKEVSRNDLCNFPVLLCTNKKIMQKWKQISEIISEKQFILMKEINALTNKCDKLLPLLMNGQVSVNYDL